MRIKLFGVGLAGKVFSGRSEVHQDTAMKVKFLIRIEPFQRVVIVSKASFITFCPGSGLFTVPFLYEEEPLPLRSTPWEAHRTSAVISWFPSWHSEPI